MRSAVTLRHCWMFRSSEAWRAKGEKQALSGACKNEAHSARSHHGMGHDGVRTRFAAGALNEKSNVGDFWMHEFPQKLELKSS